MAESEPGRQQRLPDALIPNIYQVDDCPPHEGDTGQGVVLNTNLGQINGILHPAAQEGDGAVLWVWGARGGYAGPAQGLFGNLGEEFTSRGITSLRLNYRHPSVFSESVLDALCGLEYLKSLGRPRVVLVGHSFGGAVVIGAATYSDEAVGVVSLSPQTYGAHGAPNVSPRPLLLVHGLNDTRLPPSSANRIYRWAREPKQLMFYQGTEHGLLECKDELHDLLRGWIPKVLDGWRPHEQGEQDS